MGAGAATGGPAAFDERMVLFDSGFFAFFESLVVGLVAFHMFNGLRIIAIDFVRLSHSQKQLLRMALAGLVAVMAVSGWIFFDRVFG